jgi:rRNA biogenesis protein RRP5
MKILGQIYSVQPLALVVSLPNQLFGHIPITNITSQLTSRLEALEQESERGDSQDEDEDNQKSSVPELFELFHPGQYLRTVVTTVHAPGATADVAGLAQRARDEVEKASRRVELSLVPERVNADLTKSDIKAGFVSSCKLLMERVLTNSISRRFLLQCRA